MAGTPPTLTCKPAYASSPAIASRRARCWGSSVIPVIPLDRMPFQVSDNPSLLAGDGLPYTTIVEDGFYLAIHSGDLPDSTLVARRFVQTMIILVATPQYLARHGAPESPDDLNRFRGVVFVERGSVQPLSFGLGQEAKRVIPTGVFRTSDIEQMRMGVLEHLGIAQAPAWLFAAELREGTVLRLLTAFERTVPILAVRPASRRLSTRVRIFIEHLEKTFALCSQFNPRPS